MRNKPYLSIVIPAYNEERNIASGVLDKVAKYLNSQKYTWEVLIVDDASKDSTQELVKKFCSRNKNFFLHKEPHRGKGGTVTAGMLKAKGSIILFSDMDQATPLKEVEKLLPKFEQGFDVVIGSRKGREGAPFIRKLSAWGFAFLRNLILGLNIKDTQCGFKAFSTSSVKKVFPIMKRNWDRASAKGAAVNAGFDVEILLIAKKKGLKIAEVPVVWHHVGTERVQLISDAYEAIKDMLRLRINSLKGAYK